MKIAVISDIHGNIHALRAVISDAERAGAARFILLGDYYLDMPFPNEVGKELRGIDILAMVRGNKEDYLRDIDLSDDSRASLQFGSIYWNCDNMTRENMEFYTMLPREISMDIKGGPVWAFHIPGQLLGGTGAMRFGCGRFYWRMKENPFTHKEYLAFVDSLLSEDEGVEALPRGVYLFGHTHVQWYWQGNGKLLLNPGSCGMPLDFNRDAAYSLIEYIDGEWAVEERRVSYDLTAAINALRDSGLYKASAGLSDVVIDQLLTAQERASFLLSFAEKFTAEESGTGPGKGARDIEQPFSNHIWLKACAAYKAQKFDMAGIPPL